MVTESTEQTLQENKKVETSNQSGPSIEIVDLDAHVSKHLKETSFKKEKEVDQTGAPSPGENGNGEQGQQKVNFDDPAETNQSQETDEEKARKQNLFKDKIKAFLTNKAKVASFLTSGIELLQAIALPWVYKKELFPEDELDRLPEIELEAVKLEEEEGKEKEKSEMLKLIQDIKARQLKLEKYVTEIVPFNDEEKAAVQAVIELQIQDSNFAQLIEDHPIAAMVIGVVGPRMIPLGMHYIEKWMFKK